MPKLPYQWSRSDEHQGWCEGMRSCSHELRKVGRVLFSGKRPIDLQAEFQTMVVGYVNSEVNGGVVIRRLSAFSSCHLCFVGNEDVSFKNHLLLGSSDAL